MTALPCIFISITEPFSLTLYFTLYQLCVPSLGKGLEGHGDGATGCQTCQCCLLLHASAFMLLQRGLHYSEASMHTVRASVRSKVIDIKTAQGMQHSTDVSQTSCGTNEVLVDLDCTQTGHQEACAEHTSQGKPCGVLSCARQGPSLSPSK